MKELDYKKGNYKLKKKTNAGHLFYSKVTKSPGSVEQHSFYIASLCF